MVPAEVRVVDVEATDGPAIADVFVDSFSDKRWGPYGPGGHYIWWRYPHLDTDKGRRDTQTRYSGLVTSVRAVDPSLLVKAVDAATGDILGILLLEELERPDKKLIASIAASRQYFDSDADFEKTQKLSDERDEVCWKAVSQLPANEPMMNLKLLAISPKHQARGVGTMLVKYATDRADARGMNMFVQASTAAAAVRTYEKHGFVLTVDEYIPIGVDISAEDALATRVPVLIRGRPVATS